MEKVVSAGNVGQQQTTCPESAVCSVSSHFKKTASRVDTRPTVQEHLWAIVLAGGEGERLRPLTEKWLGCHCPKQYCTFVGNRSMLEHTLERTCRIVAPNRVLTVVSCKHMKWLETSVVSNFPGSVLKQPTNLDTGPGIFLPATYVIAADPAATLLIFPSDHFIFPRERFLNHVDQLVTSAHRYSDQIVMLGAKPDRAEADYGWIEPGQTCGSSPFDCSEKTVMRVSAFCEKPSTEEALQFLEKGYLWNTMIMAVRAKTLWELGHRYFPEMMKLFEVLRSALGKDGNKGSAESALISIYQKLRPQNFSRGLLQRAVGHTLLVPMDDVDWDDWGRPERIVGSLARIGRCPAFSVESKTTGGSTNVQNRAFANP